MTAPTKPTPRTFTKKELLELISQSLIEKSKKSPNNTRRQLSKEEIVLVVQGRINQTRTEKSKKSLNNTNHVLNKIDAALVVQSLADLTKKEFITTNLDEPHSQHIAVKKHLKIRVIDAQGKINQEVLGVKFKTRLSFDIDGSRLSGQDVIERLTGAWISEKDYAELAA